MKDLTGRKVNLGSPVAHLAHKRGDVTIRLGFIIEARPRQSDSDWEVRLMLVNGFTGDDTSLTSSGWMKVSNCLLLEAPSTGTARWLP